MKLNLDIIKKIVCGAEWVEEKENGFVFHRFTPWEEAAIENNNVNCPAGVRLAFRTDGTELELGVSAKPAMEIRSYFALDVRVNGSLVGSLTNLPSEEAVGNYAEKEYQTGDYTATFDLGVGEKLVEVLLPHSLELTMGQVELPDATLVEPVKRTKRLVAYGDSITQGFDAHHPGASYAVRLADALRMELSDKGIGGATFRPDWVESHRADLVTVAFGTNDWGASTPEILRKQATAFLDRLAVCYPGVPVVVLTPIWRKDGGEERPFGPFSLVGDILREVAAGREGVRVVDGMGLMPGDPDLFGDLRLHPSDRGFAEFAWNLTDRMR